MTSKSSLYGAPRPNATTTLKENSTPGSLAFTSTLTSLLASSAASKPSSSTQRARNTTKPLKSDIFTSHNKGAKKRALADISSEDGPREQSHSKTSESVDAATLHRSKRKMEEKARLYASMKRGDYIPPKDGRGVNKEENALIDFDRKWAEDQEAGREANYETSSDDGADSDDDGNETVEYEDEFGRMRKGSKTEVAREMRKRNAAAYAKEELSSLSARPDRPTNLIYGDTVQTAAFNPDEPIAAKMDDLARKRDRSMTPPEEVHYDASKEVRSKGVGFFQFSKDEAGRKMEMGDLERERAETERLRREREERMEKKRAQIEERKRLISEKRGKKLADKFLDGLDAP